MASGPNFDYVDIGIIDVSPSPFEQPFTGSRSELSWAIGDHFLLNVELDNVSLNQASSTTRVKTKRFGFGFHNDITDNIDFVAIMTNDEIRTTEQDLIFGVPSINYNRVNGDTFKFGLRGAIWNKIEWDVLLLRRTQSRPGLDYDEAGVYGAVRYEILPDLNVGLSVETIDNDETTGLHFRYNF
jgi:hypothetical protein